MRFRVLPTVMLNPSHSYDEVVNAPDNEDEILNPSGTDDEILIQFANGDDFNVDGSDNDAGIQTSISEKSVM